MAKRMKSRIVSLLLSLCMVLTLMPIHTMTVFADETGEETGDNPDVIITSIEDDGEEPSSEVDPTDGNLDEGDGDLDLEDEEDNENPEEGGETSDDSNNTVLPPSDPYSGTFESFLKHFKELEEYAQGYATQIAGTEGAMDAVELTINYMRCAKEAYREGNWESFCGPEVTGFVNYVTEQDGKNGTDASGIRNTDKMVLPNGQKSDWLHMFAVMNMTYTMAGKSMDAQTATNYADLGGWAGDVCDMLLHTTRTPEFDGSLELEPMTRYIYLNILGYKGSVYSNTFGEYDVYADLDAYYIMNEQAKTGAMLSTIMEGYFTSSLTSSSRAQYFIDNRLGGVATQDQLRTAVEDIYSNSFLIKTLESTRELRSYNDRRKAVCYAWADYLYAMTNAPECNLEKIDLTKGQSLAEAQLIGTVSYFGETVDGTLVWADSSIVPEESGYQTAIFTPVNTFHYTQITVQIPVLVDGVEIEDPENPDQPDPEEPDEPEEPEEKPIYEVFSSKSTMLAPGVTQTVNYSNTIDNKQMVYYVATADVNRDDVTFYANYKDNAPNPAAWGMQTVKDQMNAAKARHTNPDDPANYIENYSPVVGINGDYFAMTTDGAPYGALVMEGTVYHGNTQSFFGVLKDGTPIIGGRTEWNQYKDQLQEAVGAVSTIVHNGEVVSTGDSTTGRAGFSAVGYTADGKIVFATVDGRQEPFSCGCNMVALGQIMKEAGCVEAVHLDGGGSTTFCSKPEGQDEVAVVNRPSDGFDRRVGSSLMIVSTAKSSKEFDHATIEAEYEYLTVGTEQYINASGVSNTGNAAPLPENVSWTVDDETVGTVSEDGIFTAKKVGDAVVSLVSGDTVLGSITMHIVRPNGIGFAQDEITAIFGESVPLPVTASYNGNPVKLAADTDLVLLEAENTKVGSFDGLIFTANDEENGCRTCKVTAYLWDDFEQNATALIRVYKAGEATFDFENATGGDRSFAWDREVSNSEKLDEYIYHIVDPNQSMDISYVFSLDMNYLAIPPNIEAALPELAAFMGADISEVTAWQLLVALADRVSPSTTVNITMNVDPKLDIDYSELQFICEYFDLTSINYDEENHKLNMVCSWIKQTHPIDVSLANPVAIISGIKATVKDDVAESWKDDLHLTMSGSIDYTARLRSGQAYEIASGELGKEFGLSPYDNTANLENDRGAQFSAEHCSFTDSFILSRTTYEGWSTLATGEEVYYQDNAMVTGIQYLTEPNGTEQYYYIFDDNGICEGKYTGFVKEKDGWYYPVNGTPAKGWREIDGDYYYFKSTTGVGVKGTRTLSGVTYDFENNGKLISGVWVEKEAGIRYYYGPSYYKAAKAGGVEGAVNFVVIDGNTYGFDTNGYRYTGIHKLHESNGVESYYEFDDNGVLIGVPDGICKTSDGLYYFENGDIKHAGLVKIDDDYYYFGSDGKAVTGPKTIKKVMTNGLLPAGDYVFGEDYKMIQAEPIIKNGLVEENGKLYYYEDNVLVHAGLIYLDGYYYYIDASCSAVTGTKYVTSTLANGLLSKGTYEFGPDGKMIRKNGLVEEDGKLYYYVDGTLTHAGLILVDGDYYYIDASCTAFVGTKKVYENLANGLLPAGTYVFGSDGKMIRKDGLVEENGKLHYYVDGALSHAGLILVDGDYYYIDSTGTAVTGEKYISTTLANGLLPKGTYQFGTDGKMVRKNGLIEENGKLYYYENDKLVHAGLILVDGDYYYIDGSCTAFVGTKKVYANLANGLLPAGTYEFGPDGKMIK